MTDEGHLEPPDRHASRVARQRVLAARHDALPRRLLGTLEAHRPAGPFSPRTWRSPLRGPWLTAVFGAVLLVGIPVVFATGLLSYAAYDPALRGNDQTPDKGILGFYLFDWPTHPSWLYRFTQGVHVELGLLLIPIVLAKLWTVLPRLFVWPPVRSLAQLVERASLLLLVGGIIFELATGVLNIQNYYAFGFSFYTAHFYGAWVFIGAFVVHVGIKLPRMISALRSRRLRRELATGLADTKPEDVDPDELAPADPQPPTLSRRGLLALVGGSSLAVVALTVGQTVDGPLRSTALLAPRGRSYGDGPTDFQVNKTAAAVGVRAAETGPAYRLAVVGATTATLTRAQLLALPQHTYDLPIACVEGWSTVQRWTGVRLADLARLVGVDAPTGVYVESLQRGGAFGTASLSQGQAQDPSSLLVVKVNGADLSLDHGFPARTIIPAAPGVHNTKWVRRLTFFAPASV